MSVEPFIKCTNIKRSIEFYTKILDFEVRVPPHSDEKCFDSKHCILGREKNLVHLSSHSGDGVFGILIYIRVNNLDQIYQKITSMADSELFPNSIGKLIEQSWGMKEFSLKDLDGNAITYGQIIDPTTSKL